MTAVEASRMEHDGTCQLRRITGLDINTLRRGRQKLADELQKAPKARE